MMEGKCSHCGGKLFRDGEEEKCLQCGRSPAVGPAESRAKRPYRRREVTPVAERKLEALQREVEWLRGYRQAVLDTNNRVEKS